MSATTTDSVLSPRTRWTIVGLLSASITINLLDRQVLSVLASEQVSIVTVHGRRVLIAVLLSFIVLYGYQRKVAVTCAFGLGALSMTMPFVSNDYLAVLLMGLALFGNQWVAATYIGTVGDIVPQHLAGRVNGIAGLGDNGAALLAVLYTGVVVDKYGWTPVFFGAGLLPFLAMASVFLVLRRIEPARFD